MSKNIVHFGVGNFHRAHQAVYLQDLHDKGEAQEWRIIGVGVLNHDRAMKDALAAHGYRYSLVLKAPSGEWTRREISSITDMLVAPDEPQAVRDLLASPETALVTLTITEGGYNINDETGEFRRHSPAAMRDAEDPEHPTTVFGYIVQALRQRRTTGLPPFTVLSCDNLPGNGAIARSAVLAQAEMSDPELAEWIANHVAFPNSMVDRITPVTTSQVREEITTRYGIEEQWPVSAEPFCQWVIEDNFCHERPAFEHVGADLVKDVQPYELMKLRLLNASHQILAHLGRPLGLTFAHEAATDPDIVAFTRLYLKREACPTLATLPGCDVEAYIDTLFERFANAAIADTLARLAQDASDRMPKFILGTIRDNIDAGRAIDLGAGVCAAWAYGCRGMTENGEELPVEDSHAEELVSAAKAADHGETLAFAHISSVFGDLAVDPAFSAAYTDAYESLQTLGMRAWIRSFSEAVSRPSA